MGLRRYMSDMRVTNFLLAALVLAGVVTGFAQAPEEDFQVYSDPPRLLLTKQRLKLLQRERERQSMRWDQFNALIEGDAPMPEPGFAYALHYRISGNAASGRKAVEWALGNAKDLRQLALVYDWCGPVMNKTQSDRLAAKIEQALAAPVSSDIAAQSARVLAALAIADRLPKQGEGTLRPIVEKWWRGEIAPALKAGKNAIPRERTYALFEMMHALLDNLKIDLRESASAYFKEFTTDHLAGHYPASFPAAENEYRVPVFTRDGDPDLEEAALSRAAELAMVAYDNNAQQSQFLQGWLMQDRFIMKGAFGSVYEFLWANPYQPGLSYFHMPLVFHNADTGRVFARTSWDEDATWIGFFDGRLQMFRDGQVQSLKPGVKVNPVRVGEAVLMSAPVGDSFKVEIDSEALFLLGLAPRTTYEMEIDDQEMVEIETDAGGTLVISVPADLHAEARIRKRPAVLSTAR
jgi:hypothetical protein